MNRIGSQPISISKSGVHVKQMENVLRLLGECEKRNSTLNGLVLDYEVSEQVVIDLQLRGLKVKTKGNKTFICWA